MATESSRTPARDAPLPQRLAEAVAAPAGGDGGPPPQPPAPGRGFAPGEAVRDRRTGRRMTVAEGLAPVFVYRYRCGWEAGGSGLFAADQIEPAGD